jgi:hypothetical protein
LVVVIVDAYNVLHTTGVLPPDLAGLEVDGLAHLIADSRHARDRVVLVCDGTGGGRTAHSPSRHAGPGGRGAMSRGATGTPHQGSAVHILYAGPGREADAAMETIIDREGRSGGRGGGNKRRMLVVSSDRRLRTAARRVRARWISSEGFLAQLAADARAGRRKHRGPSPRQAVPLDAYSVAEWMREFGYDIPSSGYESASSEEAGPSEATAEVRGDQGPPAPSIQRGPIAARSIPQNGTDAERDRVIKEAMRAWPGRIDEDDLDMAKWLQSRPK